MGNVTRFAALFAKVKALDSKMLTTADYLNLLACESEAQVVEYLSKKTAYGHGMTDVYNVNLQPMAVERALRQYLFDRYEQMMHFVIDEDRRLFKVLLMRYEIESLKMVIRTIYSRLRDEDLELSITSSRYFQIEDFSALFKARDLEQLVDLLMSTPYGAVLKPFLGESQQRILFFLEMNLDRYYFRRLADCIDNLSGEGRAFMEIAFGTNIDFLNVQWIYRGQKHFQLSAEELFNYCLKGGRYLGLSQLKKLCYTADSEAFVKLLTSTRYRDFFLETTNIDLTIEREMERQLFQLFGEQTRRAHFNLITPVGYLHRLEFEIRDIFAILEAKRYQLSAEHTKQFLVREVELH